MLTPKECVLTFFKESIVQAFNCWFAEDISFINEKTVYLGYAFLEDKKTNIEYKFDCEVYREPETRGFNGDIVPTYLVVAAFTHEITQELIIKKIDINNPLQEASSSKMQEIVRQHIGGEV